MMIIHRTWTDIINQQFVRLKEKRGVFVSYFATNKLMPWKLDLKNNGKRLDEVFRKHLSGVF
jgi:hypothetical protein